MIGRKMGIKKFESGVTTVRVPAEIRIALKDKGWTILQAIKNGLSYRHPSAYNEEITDHPKYKRLAERFFELNEKYVKLLEEK